MQLREKHISKDDSSIDIEEVIDPSPIILTSPS